MISTSAIEQSTDAGHAEVVGSTDAEVADVGVGGVAQGHGVVGHSSHDRAVGILQAGVKTGGVGLGATLEILVLVGDVREGTAQAIEGRGNVGNRVGPAVIEQRHAGSGSLALSSHRSTVSTRGASNTAGQGASGTNTGGSQVATQLAEQSGVGADAGGAGVDVNRSAQGTGRAGQLTHDDGTEAAGNTNKAIAGGTERTVVVETHAAFELEHGGQAVAQSLSALEADVRRVGGYAGGVTQVILGIAADLDDVEGGVSDTVDGDVGLSEGAGGSQASNGQSDQFLLHMILLLIEDWHAPLSRGRPISPL